MLCSAPGGGARLHDVDFAPAHDHDFSGAVVSDELVTRLLQVFFAFNNKTRVAGCAEQALVLVHADWHEAHSKSLVGL